jgi:hypothetical protein
MGAPYLYDISSLRVKYETGQINSSLLCFIIFIRTFVNITRIQQYIVLCILYEEIKKTERKSAFCAGHLPVI